MQMRCLDNNLMIDDIGPFYTLTEAQDKLGLTESEIRYELERQSFRATVFTKPRSMLLFEIDGEGYWIGRGVCEYRGHCALLHPELLKLLDLNTIELGERFILLVEPKGIQSFSQKYPLKGSNYPHPLIGWEPTTLDTLKSYILDFAATPVPLEYEPPLKDIDSLIKTVTNGAFNPNLGRSEPDYLYDFDRYSKFSFDDIRIPAVEIERFKERRNDIQKERQLKQEKELQGERENQLHTLIGRVLTKHPKIKAKDAWRMLELDWEADEPQFDKDGIIQNMDIQCIEWRSKHGSDSSLSYASFAPLLSKLRKRLQAQ